MPPIYYRFCGRFVNGRNSGAMNNGLQDRGYGPAKVRKSSDDRDRYRHDRRRKRSRRMRLVRWNAAPKWQLSARCIAGFAALETSSPILSPCTRKSFAGESFAHRRCAISRRLPGCRFSVCGPEQPAGPRQHIFCSAKVARYCWRPRSAATSMLTHYQPA
jgi:hypothetical protein